MSMMEMKGKVEEGKEKEHIPDIVKINMEIEKNNFTPWQWRRWWRVRVQEVSDNVGKFELRSRTD